MFSTASLKHATVVFGIVMALGVLLALAACDGGTATTQSPASTQTPATSQSTATAQPPATTLQQHHRVGEQVKAGDHWVVTVNSVTSTTESDGSVAAAGKTWLVLDMTFHDISTVAQHVNPMFDVALRDSTGISYSYVAGIGDNPISILGATVPPDEILRGQIAFEVPQREQTYTLLYTPSSNPDALTLWTIAGK